MTAIYRKYAVAGFTMTALLAGIGMATAQAADLTILHMNDSHSHLEADGSLDLMLAGEKTRVKAGGFPMAAAVIRKLESERANVLKLHAGDAVTGDLFFTLFDGAADADLMNSICFDAFALGNHEFDNGDAGLKTFLDFLAKGDCDTPVLAANVVPEKGVSPLAPADGPAYLQPYLVTDVGGAEVGIIGIDIASKTKNSSSPDPTTMFLDEAETAQKYIDELTAKGVDRIVLLTHYQYRNDLELAKTLTGVDVIIGGDSHTLLGDFDGVGLNAQGPYPTVVAGKDGATVCVAQAWEYARVVGELAVDFDDTGRVTACSGTPHIPLADSFRRKNAGGDRVELEGAARAAVLAAIDADPNLSVSGEDPVAKAALDRYAGEVDARKKEVIGEASDTLCLERIPGQGRSKICDVSATADHGSDIATLVAFAFREMSKTGDIAIQNAGGVRVDQAAGPVTVGDAYLMLPFSNTLVELTMTGAEIKSVLEDALDYALQPDGSTGAYPYASGLRWTVTVAAEKGARLTDIEFRGMHDDAWVPLDPDRSYKVITNDYIGAGRDGYLTFKTVTDSGRSVDTYLDYAKSFVDYVKLRGTVGKLPVEDYSTQRFIP
ncbi:NAD nucleotidase [Rhodospirillaceae bacterium KN72]|uniref:NAD nucleotidase n=1 Tax=Pacificispira spongiicola TaxID=2729598 RepID=A0A7Y0HFD6_9PROT|nr:NAD nucleotidase [Pacificispira spongiicola]NMM44468.1 NAD nucleotidase [Pacificispira spongiicola]